MRGRVLHAAITLLVMGLACSVGCRPTDSLTKANTLFYQGDFAGAGQLYSSQVSARPELADELKHSVALCAYKGGRFDSAIESLRSIANPSSDDRFLLISSLLAAGQDRAALDATSGLPDEDLAADPELLLQLAISAERAKDSPTEWRFARKLQQDFPDWTGPTSGPSPASLEFQFFAFGPGSLWNYQRGLMDGGWDSARDTASTLWGLAAHPIKSADDLINAVKSVFTKDNLELLLEPRRLGEVVKSAAAMEVRVISETAKERTAKRHALNLEKYEDQQKLHEIAAGYLVGYAGAEVAQILIPVGVAVKAGEKSVRAIKGAEEAAALANKLSDLRKAKVWEESLETLQRFPLLGRIPFMTPELLKGLEGVPVVAGRLPQVIADIDAIKSAAGAERLVRSIAKNGNRMEKLNGDLFELARAAHHARDGKIVDLQRVFKIELAEPGKPVRLARAIPDLVLDNKTLVEAKYRSGLLNLDDQLERQLRKYREAVKRGMYKDVRLEASGPISETVRRRCETIMEGVPFEIAENLQTGS